jgi:hypothetical protein
MGKAATTPSESGVEAELARMWRRLQLLKLEQKSQASNETMQRSSRSKVVNSSSLLPAAIRVSDALQTEQAHLEHELPALRVI